jgi:hypothetical protein
MLKRKIITFALICLIPFAYCPIVVSAAANDSLGGYGGNFEALEAEYGDESSDGSTDDASTGDTDSESETTTVTTSGDNGSFELDRDFSDDELRRLYEIKEELEETKKTDGNTFFATVCSVAGIIVIIYTVALLGGFILDKFNNFVDIEFVKLLTIGHACTLKSDDDLSQVDSKMYVFTTKRMIINSVIGFLIGLGLSMSDNILQMFYFVYDTLTGGGLS